MVQFTSTTLVLAISAFVCNVQAAPLQKRIAQVIADSTQQWEKACDAAGGGQQCNPVSVTAFSTLLAAAGPCDQQNAADSMVDLAKQLNNDPNMIKFAQIFAQQPRNTPTSQAVPYCQQAPKNSELNGLFQCQFQSADEQTFVGGLKVGSPGTIPIGMSSPVSPAGSCPANTAGPIADGSQLVSITQDPGVGNAGSGAGAGSGNGNDNNNNGGNSTAAPSSTASAPPTVSSAPTAGNNNSNNDGDSNNSDMDSQPSPSTPPAVSPSSSASGSGSGFQLQNGQDAQGQNAKFATLSADSSCQEGDQACVGNGFAQCVSGKFVITNCAGGLMCAALPLVNKPGTSITCTTQADALARIQATGAQGGITGN